MRERAIRRTALLLTWLAAAACSGTVTDTPVAPGPDTTATTPPPTTIQRTSLTVRVDIDAPDRVLASTLGVSPAGLTVRLTRAGSLDAPRNAVTDAGGTVRFDQLLDGTYTVSVERPLSQAEVARLEPADRDVTIFAGGTTVAVSPPAAPTASLSLVGARRKGLVISELNAFTNTGPVYNWGNYFEIYNNGDTTAYLDGHVLAATSNLVLHSQGYANCDEPSYLKWRADTDRIWASIGVQFPGNGRDFPIAPGESRVYAQDAVDHRAASGMEGFVDLSLADFEHYAGGSDTDNPVSANVQPVFAVGTGAGGRGMRVIGPAVWILVKPGNIQRFLLDSAISLKPPVGAQLPPQPTRLWGIPFGDVVDVLPYYYTAGHQAYLRTTTIGLPITCRPFAHPSLDRLEAEVYEYRFQGGARRRSLGRTADGREILMQTRTAARDWEITQSLLTRWKPRVR